MKKKKSFICQNVYEHKNNGCSSVDELSTVLNFFFTIKRIRKIHLFHVKIILR